MVPRGVTSARYLSDLHFSKEGVFHHSLTNSLQAEAEVFVQDFFEDSLKPYMHELRVHVKHLDTGKRTEI